MGGLSMGRRDRAGRRGETPAAAAAATHAKMRNEENEVKAKGITCVWFPIVTRSIQTRHYSNKTTSYSDRRRGRAAQDPSTHMHRSATTSLLDDTHDYNY